MSNDQQRHWGAVPGAQPWDAAQAGYGYAHQQATPYTAMPTAATPDAFYQPQYPPQQAGNQWLPGQQVPVPPTTAGVPGFPGMNGMPGVPGTPGMPQVWEPGMLPMEMSYIENILRLNRGKRVTVYMTFENNPQWGASSFTGIVQEAGRDHIIISDPETGKWYLLLMVFLNYITFDEEIAYDYPYGQAAPMAGYPPR